MEVNTVQTQGCSEVKPLKKQIVLSLSGLLFLASCQTSEVLDSARAPQQGGETTAVREQAASSPTAPPAGVSRLVARECAVFFAIEDQLEAEGRPASGKIYEGCPPGTSIGASIEPLSPAPDASSATARTFYRKMLSRGTPKDVADQVVKSKAFQDWVNAAN